MDTNLIKPITISAIVATHVLASPAIALSFDTAINAQKYSYSVFTTPIKIDSTMELLNKINSLANLLQNWDGFGADAIDRRAILNSNKFIQKLPSFISSKLNKENITPTPYGTVVLDWKVGDELISVEIGETKIGFFSEINELQNPSIEGVPYNENEIPIELVQAFKKLFKEING